jgi:PadR family transcriptional regulator, regulatory protein PadR
MNRLCEEVWFLALDKVCDLIDAGIGKLCHSSGLISMVALIRETRDSGTHRDEIPPDTLYVLILKTLALRGRLHGYEIAEHIQAGSDDVLHVEEGSLYPALQRMLIKGWVTAEWGVTAGNRRGAILQTDARRQKATEDRALAI